MKSKRICLLPPQNLKATLSGNGTNLKTELNWSPPLVNADAVSGYHIERTTWWLGGDIPVRKRLTKEPVTDRVFYDTNVVVDKINEYRVFAVNKNFPEITGGSSFPAAVYGFAYLRYNEMCEILHETAKNNPDICRLVDAGPASGKGYRIWCMVLGEDSSDNPDKPGLMLVGNPHACEIQGTDSCMGIIHEAIRRYRKNDIVFKEIFNTIQVRIVPMYNPHGRGGNERGFPGPVRKTFPPRLLPPPIDPLQIKHCWHADISGGIDPNRTFDADWPGKPDEDPAGQSYPGKKPFAAPETRALVKMAHALKPQLSVHYHGPCGFPFYVGAWEDGSFPKEQTLFLEVAREFAILSAPDFKADVPETSPYSCSIGGTAFKWCYKEFYGVHLCPEGFYEQLVSDFRVIPISDLSSLDELIPCNLNAFIWLAKRLLRASLAVHVRNEAGKPLKALVDIAGCMDKHCVHQYTDRKHGYYHRILTPGTYSVRIQSDGYKSKLVENVRIKDKQPTQITVVLEKYRNKK